MNVTNYCRESRRGVHEWHSHTQCKEGQSIQDRLHFKMIFGQGLQYQLYLIDIIYLKSSPDIYLLARRGQIGLGIDAVAWISLLLGTTLRGKILLVARETFLFDFQLCLLSGAWPLIWWHIVYRLHHTRKSAETRLSCQDEKLGRIGMIPTPLPSLIIPTFYSVLLISFFIKHSERQIDIDTWLDSNWLLPPPSPERFPMCVSRFYHCC